MQAFAMRCITAASMLVFGKFPSLQGTGHGLRAPRGFPKGFMPPFPEPGPSSGIAIFNTTSCCSEADVVLGFKMCSH